MRTQVGVGFERLGRSRLRRAVGLLAAVLVGAAAATVPAQAHDADVVVPDSIEAVTDSLSAKEWLDLIGPSSGSAESYATMNHLLDLAEALQTADEAAELHEQGYALIRFDPTYTHVVATVPYPQAVKGLFTNEGVVGV